MVVFAPDCPGVPVVVTPVVYSTPLACVPLAVVEKRKGCVPPPPFVESL